MDVDRSANIHRVALHICPAQPQQLPGPQACKRLESVSVYKVIMHPLASVKRRVDAEQLYQIGRLQHALALITGAGGYLYILRQEGGELCFAAVFAECPEIAGNQLQGFAALPGSVGQIEHVLQILIGEAVNLLCADDRQHPGTPPAFYGLPVACAGGKFEILYPQLIDVLNPSGLDRNIIL